MIHQEVILPASPDRVYAVLTDSKLLTQVTGGLAAEIGHDEGAVFSLFDSAVRGRIVELVPGKRVILAWRTRLWPDGHYSLVRFTLTPEDGGTRVVLDHTGYPDDQHEHLSAGWQANYFAPLAKYFA